MTSPKTIFLENPNDKVVLFGKEFTADELKDAVIDAHFLKGKLSELLGGK